jgi:ketosteroid isomerase-like protein
VEALVGGLNDADEDRIMALFAPDATVFFPLPENPVRVEGAAAIRAVFSSFCSEVRRGEAGPPFSSMRARDVNVTVTGVVAIVSFHLGGKVVASRRTLILVRHHQGWLIKHLHASNVRLNAS